LLPGDAQVALRDPGVPGLRTVLDDDALTDHVRRGWPGGSAPPSRVRVRYLRYKPGTLVLAAAELEHGAGTTTALVAAASVDAVAKLEKTAVYADDHPGDLPVLADGDLRMLVAPLAADRHLPGIHKLADRVRWADHHLAGAELSVLSYKPHRRLVLRADVDGIPRAVVKLHAADTLDEMVAALRWAAAARSDRLALPQLTGTDPEGGLVTTSWLPGEALDDAEPARRRATLRQVGKLVGRLHRADPTGLPSRPGTVPAVDAVLAAIGRLRPELVGPARRALASALLGPGPISPVHGDLSPDQVVHGPRGVALIDLDRTGIGTPGADLASWIASQFVVDPTAETVLPEPLLEGYRSVEGPATDVDVRARLPFELLRRATDPFRQRLEGWPERMEAIVMAAERCCRVRSAS
jgi:aminoglycoside phosphotransferase (APT) family kinase protein